MTKIDRVFKYFKVDNLIKRYSKWNNVKNLFIKPEHTTEVGVAILLVELVLNVFIIQNVSYTEIDWKAYMQECEGFLNGTLDYSELKGDTGPLVYPAGFVYIYSVFYFITNHGTDVRLAQYIFLFIYIMQLTSMLRIYQKTLKVPPYVLIITILTSYRIHSIYVLRLFNDPIAILLLFISLNLFIDSSWTMGSVFFSLAVSVKMNILLYAPALLLFYLKNLGFVQTVKQLSICGLIQLILGAPFIYGNPLAYLKGSFDVGRVFNHTWTVNYRFLDEELFENRNFHIALLVLHLLALAAFFPSVKKYFESYYTLKCVQGKAQNQIDSKNKEIDSRKRFGKPGKKQRKHIGGNTDEYLSSDQKKFLNSFEKTLKKNNKGTNIEPAVEPTNSKYSINFDTINQLFIFPMFLCNFIGIVFARSLHYQFYSWYFHTLPYILWYISASNGFRFLLLALIEFCWNTYPSTVFSSLLLHACHLYILINIFITSRTKQTDAAVAISKN